MSLRETQAAFLYAIARLIVWANDRGYEMTLAEGYVGDTDAADGDYDGPHKRDGLHYQRLALDLNLFVRGQYIRNSDSPAWQEIGHQWLKIDSLARWGGTFSKPDANHFSFAFDGKA